jgi:hypothetical protein
MARRQGVGFSLHFGGSRATIESAVIDDHAKQLWEMFSNRIYATRGV